MAISRQKIALVHVAKAQLALSEQDYREVLGRVAGVDSSLELDDAGFERLMLELECMGFRKVKHPAPATRREGMATRGQVSRIRALWKQYTGDYNEPSLERWLTVHIGVSAVRFLDLLRAGKAVGILEKMVAHKRARRAGGEELPQATSE